MTAFLDLWDRVELWLVTLPFAVQVCVMLAVGVPAALLSALVLQRGVDLVATWISGRRGRRDDPRDHSRIPSRKAAL